MIEYTDKIVEILREGGKKSIPIGYLTQDELEKVLEINKDIQLNELQELELK